MAKTEDRFIKTYSQGVMNVTEIWVDKETGVNYLVRSSGYGIGLTIDAEETDRLELSLDLIFDVLADDSRHVVAIEGVLLKNLDSTTRI